MTFTVPDALRRYSLIDLFFLVAAIALPLGLIPAWGVHLGLFISVVTAAAFYCGTRRRQFLFAAALYGAVLLGVWCYIFFEFFTPNPGPYARWYNNRLNDLATKHQLVGKPEGEVVKILGWATYVSRGWSSWDMETGEPSPNAVFGTTYNYAPFPLVPFKTFQVHCEDGRVNSLEMYDD